MNDIDKNFAYIKINDKDREYLADNGLAYENSDGEYIYWLGMLDIMEAKEYISDELFNNLYELINHLNFNFFVGE